MHSLIQPNAWVALTLPSGNVRVLQVVPDTTITLGKYGAFPSNLIIQRPYHLTYEIQDKRPGENFSRLRVVPAAELYADTLAEEAGTASSSRQDSVAVDEADKIISAVDGVEYSLVDETGSVVVRSNREVIDDSARQTLTHEEIEELKRDGTGAGKDIIAKLLLSHTAIDQKTSFSLAKYKLLKTKKYIRRFGVLPLDTVTLAGYMLNHRDGSKLLDMRDEMLGLVGCWANVHFGGDDRFCMENGMVDPEDKTEEAQIEAVKTAKGPEGTRFLVVDDTGGLLVAALAERMGILYPAEEQPSESQQDPNSTNGDAMIAKTSDETAENEEAMDTTGPEAEEQTVNDTPDQPSSTASERPRRYRAPRHHGSDFRLPFSTTNTLTLVHSSGQPNLSLLSHYDFDVNDPNPPPHPLATHLLPLTWLQLLEPNLDTVYTSEPPSEPAEVVNSWKPNRRGNYHRKRRRWARTRYIADSARAGGFAGLAVASTMDPISVLRPLLPLLAGGAQVAVYSQSVEPLTELADCFSISRRGAWSLDPEMERMTAEELERWEGSDEFPINPMLLLNVQIHTSRARSWQVLPGRTHPVMTAKGGPEGYILTGWRARPLEGRVEARGKFKRRKVAESTAAED